MSDTVMTKPARDLEQGDMVVLDGKEHSVSSNPRQPDGSVIVFFTDRTSLRLDPDTEVEVR